LEVHFKSLKKVTNLKPSFTISKTLFKRNHELTFNVALFITMKNKTNTTRC
jgi:hypothetical protein